MMFILRNRLLKALSCLTKNQLNNTTSTTSTTPTTSITPTTSNTINHNNNNIQLGRWNINYDEEKLTTIIRLANEDHCGVCNEIQITQPQQLKENSHHHEQHKPQHKPYQYQKSQQESYEKIYILDDINVNRECVIKLVCCGKECSNCKYITKLNKEKLKL